MSDGAPSDSISRTFRSRRLVFELVAVFCASVLLALVRIALPEPARDQTSTAQPAPPEQDPNVNRRYDRTNDERDFYFPVIAAIHARWPKIDLQADSLGDKPPGYPFLMATVAQWTGLDLFRLRLVHALWSASISILLYYWLRTHWSTAAACTLLAPFLFSSFYIKSSAYLTTDNPALFFVVASLFIVLRTRCSLTTLATLLTCNVAAVWIRQNTLWLIAPTLVVAARLAFGGGRDAADTSGARGFAPLLAFAAAALPCALMLHLWLAWDGFVPPSYYQKATRAGFGLAPLVYCLSVFALCWWPYLLSVHGARTVWTILRRPFALVALLAGLAIAIAADMTYSQQTGNWGGYLWTAAAFLPSWGRGSIVFVVLAPLGALAIASAVHDLVHRDRLRTVLLGLAMLGWALACMANPYVFHRYYEPYAIVFMLALIATNRSGSHRPFSPRNYAWTLLFAAGQLVISIATLFLSFAPHLRR